MKFMNSWMIFNSSFNVDLLKELCVPEYFALNHPLEIAERISKGIKTDKWQRKDYHIRSTLGIGNDNNHLIERWNG